MNYTNTTKLLSEVLASCVHVRKVRMLDYWRKPYVHEGKELEITKVSRLLESCPTVTEWDITRGQDYVEYTWVENKRYQVTLRGVSGPEYPYLRYSILDLSRATRVERHLANCREDYGITEESQVGKIRGSSSPWELRFFALDGKELPLSRRARRELNRQVKVARKRGKW
jgi:hypothetical protein